MLLTAEQQSQVSKRLSAQRQWATRREDRESEETPGEIEFTSVEARGYRSVLVYIERGMGDSIQLVNHVLKLVAGVQTPNKIEYEVFLFSFGWDDGVLHCGPDVFHGQFNSNFSAWGKRLCELSGTERSGGQSTIPSLFLFPKFRSRKRDIGADDLLLFVCRDRHVQMSAAGSERYQGVVARNSLWVFAGDSSTEVEFGFVPAQAGLAPAAKRPSNAGPRTERRGLSQDFMDDLKRGLLAPVLALVRADTTLSLCIRNEAINIYYRGGSLLCINRDGSGAYVFTFNENYAKGHGRRSGHLPRPDFGVLRSARRISDPAGVTAWLSQIPLLKFTMDLYLTGRHNPEPGDQPAGVDGGTEQLEGEYQQLVERANNSDRSTDYFILDIEYCVSGYRDFRLDMIGLRWPAHGRREGKNQYLAILEMKYRESAVDGKCGLADHIAKLAKAVEKGKLDISALADEMAVVTTQRVELGLFDWPGSGKINVEALRDHIRQTSEHPLEYVIVLGDYPPESPRLAEEMLKVEALGPLPFKVSFATANCTGYGLYEYWVCPWESFREQLPLRSAKPRAAARLTPRSPSKGHEPQ